MLRNKILKSLAIILASIPLLFTGCGGDTTDGDGKPVIKFGQVIYDSMVFHDNVMQFIVENGYGYETDTITGSTPITFAAVVNGDVDIMSEVWVTNMGEKYPESIDDGSIHELSVNFDDNAQGLYVPTYMIEGDSARGIDPVAPDLKSVTDLPQYWELFKDPEDPSKGRIVGSIPGWEADNIMREKVESYGLDDTYTYFSPGSETALSSSIVKAFEEGEPWVGYYWEPTWLLGKYDMTLLEEAEYSEELWNDGYKSEFPAVPVTVVVHNTMLEKAPDVVDFLRNYETSSDLISEALAWMADNEKSMEETAQWFLKEKEDIWTEWIPADVADKVKGAL